MAYDYKVDRHKPAPTIVPGWMWLLIGLGTGLVVALLMYLILPATGSRLQLPLPSPDKFAVPPKTDTRVVLKTPLSDLDSEPGPPRFDFYTILPEMEIAIPEEEIGDPFIKSTTPADQSGTYILQAGAFKTVAEADRLRASLILQGIEASIQTVTIDNKDTWHRVRIGPYKGIEEMNKVRARLKEEKIESILLRIKS